MADRQPYPGRPGRLHRAGLPRVPHRPCPRPPDGPDHRRRPPRLTRKGSPRHVRAGRWYYRAITAVFATATALAVMRWRQDYYLFVIGAIAFTAATIGYLHRRRHRPGDTTHILGMGIAYTAMLTAFYVDNGPHLPLWDHLPVLAFWLLPSAIAAPLITRASSAPGGASPPPADHQIPGASSADMPLQGGGNEPVADPLSGIGLRSPARRSLSANHCSNPPTVRTRATKNP